VTRLFLDPRDYARWSACPGSPALCEADPEPKRRGYAYVPTQQEEAVAAHKARGADVQVIPGDRLNLEPITGERGAQALVDTILIVTEGEMARLEVWQPSTVLKGVPVYFDAGKPTDEARFLALAALHKYSLLHQFTDTNCGSIAELYSFREMIQPVASLALELRNNVDALGNLVVGDHCKGCPAAYRCPQLAKGVHEDVFGEIQALDEPVLTPLPLATRVSAAADITQVLRAALQRLPLIHAWCDAVLKEGVSRGLLTVKTRPAAKPKKSRRHRKPRAAKATSTSPRAAD